MRKTTITLAVLLFAFVSPALALGPVDVEVGAAYWLSDTSLDFAGESLSADSADMNLWGQIWVTKWGAKAAIYKTDLDHKEFDGSFQIDYTSLDLRYKVLELTDNNFIAVGVGYQKVEFDSVDASSLDTTGWRVSTEAHIGLGRMINFYGDGAYYFGLDDISQEGDTLARDPSGWELEVGVSFKPAPFLNIRAGYRKSSLDMDILDGGPRKDMPSTYGYSIDSDGFILGVSANF